MEQSIEFRTQPEELTLSPPPEPSPTKAEIARATGMPVLALTKTSLKLSDLIGLPRYEVSRER